MTSSIGAIRYDVGVDWWVALLVWSWIVGLIIYFGIKAIKARKKR